MVAAGAAAGLDSPEDVFICSASTAAAAGVAAAYAAGAGTDAPVAAAAISRIP